MTPTNPITEAREALDHIHTWEEDLDFREQRKAITAALDYAETQAIEIGRLKADRNDWHDNYQSLAVRFEEQRDDLTSIKAKLAKAEEAIRNHLNALDLHEKSNDGFGKSRETYAAVMATLATLRQFPKGEEG